MKPLTESLCYPGHSWYSWWHVHVQTAPTDSLMESNITVTFALTLIILQGDFHLSQQQAYVWECSLRIQFNFTSKTLLVTLTESLVDYMWVALWLILTWDVVDGDGKDEEKNSSPAASCPSNLFLLFTSCFVSIWAARMRSSPPLVHISILYFICMTENNNNTENRIMPMFNIHTC